MTATKQGRCSSEFSSVLNTANCGNNQLNIRPNSYQQLKQSALKLKIETVKG